MSGPAVTLVTYHYVRPLAGSRFPALKALDLKAFEAQLDYLERHYQFVAMDSVIALFNGEPVDLPPNPVLLTFDDGYADHFRFVFPRLVDRGIPGAFFPAAVTAIDREILDSNRIHFVLAAIGKPDPLIEMIEAAVEAGRHSHQLRTVEQYRSELMTKSRFDEPRTAYAKRMLQFALPDDLRREIADAAFRQFVSADVSSFAEELYMNAAELRIMRANGMHIGLHGDRHVWLGRLSREAQVEEIAGSFRLLEALGSQRSRFSFCFPYGNYNDDTLQVLDELGCALALTTRPAVARLGDPRLEIPRLDTNHIPRG